MFPYFTGARALSGALVLVAFPPVITPGRINPVDPQGQGQELFVVSLFRVKSAFPSLQ